MDELLNKLKRIIGLLEQINDITTNQTTLIMNENAEQSESDLESIMEEMSHYKEQLMTQTEQEEDAFEKIYYAYRSQLVDKEEIKILKEKVSQVLEIKKKIIENENMNMLMVQNRNRQKSKINVIPQNPQRVAELYKKHIKK